MFGCGRNTTSVVLNRTSYLYRSLRRLIFVSAILPIASISTSGQSQTDSSAVFKAKSELVLVPVIVTENGRYVTGLKQDSFILFDDNRKQEISVFEEVLPTTHAPARAARAPGYYTNYIWNDEVPARATVFLFDLINISSIKQEHARKSLSTFLSALPDTQDPMMLAALTPNGIKVLHDFTSKASVLRESLYNMRGMGAVKEYTSDLKQNKAEAQMAADAAVAATNDGHSDASSEEVERLRLLFQGMPDAFSQAQDMNRTSFTLQLLQQLAHALAGIPGRKSLVWVTGGLEYTVGSEPDTGLAQGFHRGQIKAEGLSSNRIAEGNDAFDRTWDELASANVAVYPVDLEEISNPAYSDAGSMSSTVPTLMGRGFGTKAQAMNGFPDKTGGSYCELQSRLEDCFRDAVHDSARYYVLGYRPSSNSKSTWHRLKIDVSLKHVKVRARSGYFYGKSGSSSFQSDIQLLLTSPIDATGIPLALRWAPSPSSRGKDSRKHYFEIFIDPSAIAFDGPKQNQIHLKFAAAARDGKTGFSEKFLKTIDANLQPSQLASFQSEGFIYRDAVLLEPTENEVRIVVRDEVSGRLGSITVPIEPR